MNKHTPAMSPIETREMPAAPRDIDDQRLPLDAPAAETVIDPVAVKEPEARAVTAAAEEAGSTVPDAVKQAETTRRALERRLESARARGVEWVRASDLLSRGTGRMAGAGIRWHQAAGAQTRRGLTVGVRAVSERVRGLPPVSAFGRRSVMPVGTVRSGVGMR